MSAKKATRRKRPPKLLDPAPHEESKTRIYGNVSQSTSDRLQAAAAALRGQPHLESKSGIIERALLVELEKLEKRHGPFKRVSGTLPPGRPLKT